MSRRENPSGKIRLCHVCLVGRGGQGVHLMEGKSRCCGAAVSWRSGATESFSFLVAVVSRDLLLFAGSGAAPNISLSSHAMEGDGSGKGGETSDGVLDQKVVTAIEGHTTISLATETVGVERWIGLRTALGTASRVVVAAAKLLEARQRNGLGKIRGLRKIRSSAAMKPPRTERRDHQTQQPTKNRKRGRPVREEKGA